MPSRIAKTKRPVQRKNGKNLSAKTLLKTPSGISPGLARMLRPQAVFRWLGPSLASVTPTYIESTLRSAMQGDHTSQWDLFELMFNTWPELSSCAQELKYGLMRKNLIFEAYHEEDEQPTPSAMEKSKLVSAALRQMSPASDHDENALEGTLMDILDGWFRGVTLLEVVWNAIEAGKLGMIMAPRTTFFVHPSYYAFTQEGMLGLRPIDQRNLANGTFPYGGPATQQPRLIKLPEHKFLVGIHKAKSGTALAGSLLRPLSWWWCASNFSSDWLLNLAQVFGLPFRWANYNENAPQETVDAICTMLQNMGSNGWAAFPVGTTMELKAAPGGGSDHSPQGELLDRADGYCRTLILGQTMTGGRGTTGKGGGQAFGTVEQDVKNDRIDAAGRYIAGVLNEQLIKSILMLNYGEASEAPEARFLEEHEGELATAQRDQVLVSMGMPIGVDYLRKKYDIPEPSEGEEVVSGISTGQQAAEDAKTEMAKAALEQKAQDPNAPPGDPNKPPPQGKKPDGKAMKAKARSVAYYHAGQMVRVNGSADGKFSGSAIVKIVVPHSNRAEVTDIDKRGVAYNKGFTHLPTATVELDRSKRGKEPLQFEVAHHQIEVIDDETKGHWVTINGAHVFIKEAIKSSELHAKNEDLDFYLGDLREKFFQAFKGDLAPLRSALEVALAEKSEPEQREALIALKPQLPQLLNTFISEGVSARILAKAISRAFTEGWHQPKTEFTDSLMAQEGGHWVTIHGHHVFIKEGDTRPAEEILNEGKTGNAKWNFTDPKQIGLVTKPSTAEYKKDPSDFTKAAHAAASYAKKQNRTMMLVPGNSFMHKIYSIQHATEDIHKVTVTGDQFNVALVHPDGRVIQVTAIRKQPPKTQ